MSSVKRVDFEVDFTDVACKSTLVQENPSNTADAEVSIIPEVSVAVPVGAGVKLEDRLRVALRVKGLALTTEEVKNNLPGNLLSLLPGGPLPPSHSSGGWAREREEDFPIGRWAMRTSPSDPGGLTHRMGGMVWWSCDPAEAPGIPPPDPNLKCYYHIVGPGASGSSHRGLLLSWLRESSGIMDDLQFPWSLPGPVCDMRLPAQTLPPPSHPSLHSLQASTRKHLLALLIM